MRQTGVTAPASMRHRRTAILVAAAATALALLGPGAQPAGAHTHPTAEELTEPAVVRVETSVKVNISLIEHDRGGRHIGLLRREYELMTTAGSGFAVDPSGVIVAAGGVIVPDNRKAEIFAVNKVFNERYGRRAPLPADPTKTQTIRDTNPDDPINGRLQRCYKPNTTDSTGGCLTHMTRLVRVYPFVASQKQHGNLSAEVLYPTNGKADVAVLKVGASSMPTVDLAPSTEQADNFSTLGFTKVPTDPPSDKGPMVKNVGHLIGDGPDVEKDKYQPKLVDAIIAGVWGGPVVGRQGRTAGFLQVRPTGVGTELEPYLTDVNEIRAALKAADVQPRRGPTDAVYEAAMHNFKNKHYAAAIPSLTQTVRLYPGHALATHNLDVANQKKGTPEDLSGSQSGVKGITASTDGLSPWVIAGIVGLLAVLALLGMGALRRYRGDGRSSPAPPATAAPPPASANRERTATREPMSWPRSVWAPEPKEQRERSTPSAPATPAPRPAPEEARAVPAPRRAPVATVEPRDAAPAEIGFCTDCGKPLGHEHKFCGYCGHKAR
jgi:hypothetical protein